MDNFTDETVERMLNFAMFLENFKGRIIDARGPAKQVSHNQIETWELIEAELSKRAKEQQATLEQAADASRVISNSRLHQATKDHVAELDRLMTALRPNIAEAQSLEERLLGADREVEMCEDSTVAAGIANLRQYAGAIRQYLEVRNSGY